MDSAKRLCAGLEYSLRLMVRTMDVQSNPEICSVIITHGWKTWTRIFWDNNYLFSSVFHFPSLFLYQRDNPDVSLEIASDQSTSLDSTMDIPKNWGPTIRVLSWYEGEISRIPDLEGFRDMFYFRLHSFPISIAFNCTQEPDHAKWSSANPYRSSTLNPSAFNSLSKPLA